MSLEYEVTELNRRLANMLCLGVISQIDLSNEIPKARVIIGDIETAFLVMLMPRAGNDISFWSYEVGEQVLVLSPSGDLSQGVIIGSINQSAIPAVASSSDIQRTRYSDGAIIEYDRSAHHLKAVLPDGAKTTLISNGGVFVTGDVKVTGNIKATGDITDHTRSMQADRVIYNEHDHSGVRKGSSKTRIPNQSQ